MATFERKVYLQPFHEPAVLLRCELPYLSFVPRPLVYAAFQALVQKDKAVLLPVQPFDPIPAASAEQKQCVREGIQVKFLLNHGRKTVDAFPQICVSAGNIHMVGPGEVI